MLSLYFLIMFVIGTDTFLISPLLPVLRNQFHVSVSSSGWMMGAYALGYALCALVAGPLSDSFNRKQILMYGMLGFAFSTALCGLANSFWTMVMFRASAGIFAAIAAPQVWASIPILVPKDAIIRSMGIATAGLAVSQTLGVPIGAYLAVHSWAMPFFLIGVVSFLLVPFIALYIPDLPSTTNIPYRSIRQRYVTLLKEPRAQKAFFAYFLFQTGNFAAFTFLGTWLTDRFHLRIDGVGDVLVFLGLGNIVGSFFGSVFVQKIGQHLSVLLGFVIMILVYAFVADIPTDTYAKAAFFLIFLVAGTVFPIMMSALQTLSITARGTIASLSNATMYGATTLGSYIAGFLYTHGSGFGSVTLFTVCCYTISLVVWLNSAVLTGTKNIQSSSQTAR